MTAVEFGADAARDLIMTAYRGAPPKVIAQVNRWLARGDGVAVYTNQDLGHRDLGNIQIVSFGSGAAMLETDVPPEVLPDIGGAINWRYQLTGTYRGDPL